jgi:plasmid stabilization system protein ParE
VRGVAFAPRAEDDLTDAYDYFERQRRGLEFERDVAETLDRIRENPYLAPEVARDVHRVTMHRFRYNVVYEVTPSPVVVLAVLHRRRDPSSWQGRLWSG